MDFGAACWYFGQKITDLGIEAGDLTPTGAPIPLGLVNTAIGGQRIEEYQVLYTIQYTQYVDDREEVYQVLYTIHHTPYTIHHAPYTMHHAPCTIHHAPYTIHHAPYTIHSLYSYSYQVNDTKNGPTSCGESGTPAHNDWNGRLFARMVMPFVDMTTFGFLWYQVRRIL
jgi:hypothetical protein